MANNKKQKLDLELEGVNGNAFALMSFFKEEASRAEWTKEQIDEVITECMSGDYHHLLQTLMQV